MFLNSRNLIYSFSSKELYQFFNTLTHRNQTVLCFMLTSKQRNYSNLSKVSIKIEWRSPCLIKKMRMKYCVCCILILPSRSVNIFVCIAVDFSCVTGIEILSLAQVKTPPFCNTLFVQYRQTIGRIKISFFSYYIGLKGQRKDREINQTTRCRFSAQNMYYII